jgi:hypothetical protein
MADAKESKALEEIKEIEEGEGGEEGEEVKESDPAGERKDSYCLRKALAIIEKWRSHYQLPSLTIEKDDSESVYTGSHVELPDGKYVLSVQAAAEACGSAFCTTALLHCDHQEVICRDGAYGYKEIKSFEEEASFDDHLKDLFSQVKEAFSKIKEV